MWRHRNAISPKELLISDELLLYFVIAYYKSYLDEYIQIYHINPLGTVNITEQYQTNPKCCINLQVMVAHKRTSENKHYSSHTVSIGRNAYKIDRTGLPPGLLFMKRTPTYGYRNPYHKSKAVWRPSQVYNENPLTNTTVSS